MNELQLSGGGGGSMTLTGWSGLTADAILFASDATTLAQASGLKWGPTAGLGLQLAAGTATTDVNALSITQTMNAAAVNFTGSKWIFTEGASGTAAGTLLFDILYGTSGGEVSKFSITKAGRVSTSELSLSGHLYTVDGQMWKLGTTTDTGISRVSAGVIGIGTGAVGSVAGTLSLTGIELGHATDTTLSRSAAGVLAVEGVVIPSISSTNTLTNKRMTKRTGTTTSHATPTINTDNVDAYFITAQAEAITSFTTNLSGTPTEGQGLLISITGTAARAITWGASFEASTVALPTTTVTTARLDVAFIWNSVSSKWRCTGSA
mgnify:CR=1 FL=1